MDSIAAPPWETKGTLDSVSGVGAGFQTRPIRDYQGPHPRGHVGARHAVPESVEGGVGVGGQFMNCPYGDTRTVPLPHGHVRERGASRNGSGARVHPNLPAYA